MSTQGKPDQLKAGLCIESRKSCLSSLNAHLAQEQEAVNPLGNVCRLGSPMSYSRDLVMEGGRPPRRAHALFLQEDLKDGQ